MRSVRIVITDCDHESMEEEVAAAAGESVDLVLDQCRTEDEVIAAAVGAEGIVVQYAPITARVLDALPNLKAIGRYGVGFDTIDVGAATARGVAVCNVPDYGTEDVSDHAIALALALARGVVVFDRRMRVGQYALGPVRPLHRIKSRVFGVVGLGLIGSATARKAKGLGYRVIGCDSLLRPGTTSSEGVAVVGFEELLSQSDVVSLHVPLSATTHHLMNEGALAKMKPGAVLINTSRGGVVDTEAITAALRTGALRGAALDVFEDEPLKSTSPLFDLPTAVLTPHVSWYSEESYSELKTRTIANVIDVCAGREPQNIINPEVLA